MKNLCFLFFLFLFFGCSNDKVNNNNPFLPNYAFTFDINTNLPSYSNLKFTGNHIKIYPANGPSRGVIVFNTTGTAYNAFDGGCPNQDLSSCSTLTISGIEATCPCDDAKYNLYSGQSAGKEYPLKAYRIEVIGDIIRVSN